jgi:small-conductance mechanosensitive channel
MKKLIFCCILILGNIISAQAVLKERNLVQTISVLKVELESYQKELHQRTLMTERRQQESSKFLLRRSEEIDQITLMLYSQKNDYIFDLAYACNEATTAYDNFFNRNDPFQQFQNSIISSVQQYNGLINSLKRIPPFALDGNKKALQDRQACVQLAMSIRTELLTHLAQLKEFQQRREMMGQKLTQINKYALSRYNEIQKNIFVNGGDNYFTILSRLSRYTQQANRSLSDKYPTVPKSRSEWGGKIVVILFTSVLFYLIVSSLLCYVVIRWLMRHRFESEAAKTKRPYIILAASMITFAVMLMILRSLFISHNFFLMASQLLVQYAWLVGIILISLLVRFSDKQINSGFRIYIPMIFIGFIVIVFRIVFIPNEMVNLLFPPLILFATIWQWSVMKRHNKNIIRTDYFYTWISFLAMVASVLVSWSGYTLLGVQILIWWIMLLTSIQTITCAYDLLSMYEAKRFKEDSDITKTWFFDFIRQALVPIIAVYAFMISIYWAASVFSLTEWCNTIFSYNFIDIKNVAQVSFQKLSLALALFFPVKYIVYIGKAFFYRMHKTKKGERKVSAIGINIATIVIWFFYIMVAMLILNVNQSGLVVAIGGMSTGIGFALKDTIENLFYGISLMTGRLHIGDVIECDGVRGKVTDINYQSTLVEPVDGSIIAFLNSQLFQKNFKNLTRNHGYEMVTVPVGVAYGTNVERARTLVLDSLQTLDCYNKKQKPSILFSNFGDNSVDLLLSIWVPVATKVAAVSKIKENIYNVFNANGIEMPFPQRDIYVHEMDKK